jgi:hypothetical protein
MSLRYVTSSTFSKDNLDIPLVVAYDSALGNHPNSEFYKQTLVSHNWEYAFINVSDKYRGHYDKILGYYEMLLTLPADKIVVLSDCWDVVCCRNVKAFMAAYASMKSDFIVSMELFCNSTTDIVTTPAPACMPLTTYWKHHTNGIYPLRKYVNSGLIVGKASCLMHFYKYVMEKKAGSSDQISLGCYMNDYPERVCVDVDRILLHSTTFGKSGGCENMNLQKQDAPTYSELFGRDSFFLHFPGCGFKGQKFLYDFTCSIIKQGYDSRILNKLYDHDDFNYFERL